MIIILGSIVAKPDHVSDVRTLSLDHVQRSQREPGCISHNVSVDCEDPQRFVFVETWSDMAAVQLHFGLAASRKFIKDLTPFLAAQPIMKIYDANEAPAT